MTADPQNLTDLGNSRRLVERHGANLRYCPSLGWFAWDTRRWAKDDTAEVMRDAKETARSIYAEAEVADDPEERKRLAKWAMRSEAEPQLRRMIALAQSETEVVVRPERLDADSWLLTVLNGTLDLRRGELRPHRREDLITKLAPVAYDPEATCPTWAACLRRWFAEDAALIRFVQKAAGHSLTGDTREQVIFIPYGTGSNGKTSFVRVLLDLLGDYGCQTRTETLLVKRGDAIPNDVARLHRARLVAAVEADAGRRLAEGLVKQLSGGDRVVARFLHREFFEFTPTFKVWLAVNHKPTIRGTDHAIWRRVRLIPFDVTIPEREQDRALVERLKGELPGILTWAVEGCQLWQQEGLGLPLAVRTATAGYRAEMDAVGTFLGECCVSAPDAEVAVGELYEAYTTWCARSGEEAVSKKALSTLLEERGFAPGHSETARLRRGLRLRRPDEPELPAPVPVGADVEWQP